MMSLEKEVNAVSQYTTGEIAKLCGVSVRTVQYYDGRGLLAPSAVSEGGRRLYSEDDVRRLRVICFLRGMGLTLGSIADILEADNRENVIALLLDEQEQTLREEVKERQEQIDHIRQLRQEMKSFDDLSVDHLHDIARIMENKKKLRKVRAVILTIGIIAEIIEWASIIWWIKTGNWVPAVIGLSVFIALCIYLVKYYYDRVHYICPECHAVFQPRFGQFFWARHTPKTRKLTCTSCGHTSFCVETAADKTE